jgi:hypothetical protein
LRIQPQSSRPDKREGKAGYKKFSLFIYNTQPTAAEEHNYNPFHLDNYFFKQNCKGKVILSLTIAK